MASRKPLVLGANGLPQQLQSGDTLAGGGSGGSGVTVSKVAIDFGSTPHFGGKFAFTATGATVGRLVVMVPSADMLDGLNPDELEMDGFSVAAYVSEADTITAVISPLSGPVVGRRNFNFFFA